MNRGHKLQPDTALVLEQAVARAFRSALGETKEGRSARSFTSISAAIDACFANSLIQMKRSFNILCSRQTRLPAELWVLVWMHLPLRDCIAVSHVCHAWRQNSISCPRLWDVVNIVSKTCVCQRCMRGRELDAFNLACAGSVVSVFPPTNIPMLPVLLERGRQRPFSLTIHVSGHTMDEEMSVGRLARALVPHAARVSSITITIPAHQLLGRFFAHFAVFPAATHLQITCAPYANNGFSRGSFLMPQGEILFAQMRSLVISKDLGWPQAPSFALPSLRELDCSFRTVAELKQILKACPHVNTWTVRPPFHLTVPPEVHFVEGDELARELQRIDVVKLAEVDSIHLPNILTLFGYHERPHFEINFWVMRAGSHAENALAILRHCTDAIGISCAMKEGRMLHLSVLSPGRLRNLTIPSAPDTLLPLVWPSHLPSAAVGVLGACLATLPLLCRSQPPPDLSLLLELQLHVDQPVNALAPVRLGLPAPLSSLQILTVTASSPTITIPVAWVCSLIQSLELGRELPLLSIRDTSIVGPLELLRGLVVKIKDAGCGDAEIVSFMRTSEDN